MSRSPKSHSHDHDVPNHGRQRGPSRHALAFGTVSPRPHVRAATTGFTLAHCGRRTSMGPLAFWLFVGTLVVMAAWSMVTGTYFVLGHDALSRLIRRDIHIKIAYEDRVASLRVEIDRLTSRHMLDQSQFDRRLTRLLKHQATLESRTSQLSHDFSAVRTNGSSRQDSHAKQAKAGGRTDFEPLDDDLVDPKSPGSGGRVRGMEHPSSAKNSAVVAGTLDSVAHALDIIASRQKTLLAALQMHFDRKVRQMHQVLRELTVKVPLPPAEGGPFIPATPAEVNSLSFKQRLHLVDLARVQAQHYNRALQSIPIRKPLSGILEVTSPFGPRRDPFLGTPAFHPGIDLAGSIGEPIHATANGKVLIAGWDGGYGNLVEIKDGYGMLTRFGHMSKILVRVGQRVQAGQTIGLIGSTGRSTGPHLHYEIRINDKPVDPERFLHAGRQLSRS